ncbi:MAG: FtsQ-type POTRA domain-containing protein [Candidatus Obscuribacterales bacterium]|nr:FtsQ-type POTRA domain-containing protein [Candidatus Obscuribacterales bacterium]
MAYIEERADRIRGRRTKRKQARTARLRRQVLRYVLLFSLLYVGVAAFVKVQWSLPDPDMDVKVSGNLVVSSAQVKQVLMPLLKKPVYSLSPKELEARVKSLPDVNNAFVRRYLFPRPHINVHIMEEFPWASVAAGPESPVCGVVSETGRYIPVSQFPNVPQPPLRIFAEPCIKLSQSEVRSWANCVNFVAAQTGTTVDIVDLRKKDDIRMQAGELQLRLGAADSSLLKRLNRLPSILPVLATIKEHVDYINLGLDSNIPLKVSKLTPKQEAQRRAGAGQSTGDGGAAPQAVPAALAPVQDSTTAPSVAADQSPGPRVAAGGRDTSL